MSNEYHYHVFTDIHDLRERLPHILKEEGIEIHKNNKYSKFINNMLFDLTFDHMVDILSHPCSNPIFLYNKIVVYKTSSNNCYKVTSFKYFEKDLKKKDKKKSFFSYFFKKD